MAFLQMAGFKATKRLIFSTFAPLTWYLFNLLAYNEYKEKNFIYR